jgi:hypothetical protein
MTPVSKLTRHLTTAVAVAAIFFGGHAAAQDPEVRARIDYEIAKNALAAGEYAKALKRFESVLAVLGPLPELHYYAAKAAVAAGDMATAKTHIEGAFSSAGPEFKKTPEYLELFNLAVAAGDPAGAKTYIESALSDADAEFKSTPAYQGLISLAAQIEQTAEEDAAYRALVAEDEAARPKLARFKERLLASAEQSILTSLGGKLPAGVKSARELIGQVRIKIDQRKDGDKWVPFQSYSQETVDALLFEGPMGVGSSKYPGMGLLVLGDHGLKADSVREKYPFDTLVEGDLLLTLVPEAILTGKSLYRGGVPLFCPRRPMLLGATIEDATLFAVASASSKPFWWDVEANRFPSMRVKKGNMLKLTGWDRGAGPHSLAVVGTDKSLWCKSMEAFTDLPPWTITGNVTNIGEILCGEQIFPEELAAVLCKDFQASK